MIVQFPPDGSTSAPRSPFKPTTARAGQSGGECWQRIAKKLEALAQHPQMFATTLAAIDQALTQILTHAPRPTRIAAGLPISPRERALMQIVERRIAERPTEQ